MMIVRPGSNRYLERKYQVLAILIFGVRGIQNLSLKYPVLATLILEVPAIQNFNFKYPSLGTLISELPGIQNLQVKCPALVALIFGVPGIQDLSFEQPAAGHKVTPKKKCISFCEDKSLVVKIDIVIFLSYFVEKVFLNFMFKHI